ARGRAGRRVEEPLDFGRREGARQLPAALRELEARRRVVGARPQEHLVAEEGADGGQPARDRRGREAVRAELRHVGGEVVGARLGWRAVEPRAEVREVAPVRLDGAWREPGGGDGEEALDGGIEGRHAPDFGLALPTPSRMELW